LSTDVTDEHTHSLNCRVARARSFTKTKLSFSFTTVYITKIYTLHMPGMYENKRMMMMK